ncbi:MAG: M28 family peptidase [Gemmatimonadetes bacterium]|nr:M28 family peptidase [Gemmatimonadota bacterium]
MRYLLSIGFFLAASLPAPIPQLLGQTGGAPPAPPPVLRAYQGLAQEIVSGDGARAMVDFMDPSYRVPGNRAYNSAIQEVARALEAAGYAEESEAEEARLTYRIETREMSRPAWDPIQASLGIVGRERPLMTLETNINLMAAYSHSIPGGGVEAELVDVGRGSPQDFEGKDVRGKVVLGDGSTGQLFRRAVQEHGALGVLAYRLSSFNRPEVNRTIAVMSSIPYDQEAEAWGLAISLNARDELRNALAAGPVRVRVEVESDIYPSEELTLVADVRGTVAPEERFVYCAHVQESGANDNATGVAALTEVARVFGEGVRAGTFDPQRTISMIWGDEISSTRRYLEEDAERMEGIRWGLSLDMVGEDTQKTGGTFLIEKMPDPSAVWTRGDDRHTEWGGRPMTVEQMVPHYFNDYVLGRCQSQAAATGWAVGTNPYEGGSDHVPFLRAGIPGILLWHFTDQFYHTDGDRLEMVSAETLENSSVCAAVSAMALTTADAELASYLIEELEHSAQRRLGRESQLGRSALEAGGDYAEQRLILATWTQWYLSAIRTTEDIQVGGPSPAVLSRIDRALDTVAEAGREAIGNLGGG